MNSDRSNDESRTQLTKPNYQALWCWTCQEHTAYHLQAKTRRVHSSDGPSRLTTDTTFTCEICDKKMHTPQAVDPVIFKRPAERGCLWIYGILAALGLPLFYWFLADGFISHVPLLLVIFLPVAATVVALPGLVIRWSAKKYGVWKSWATQRGWKEPKPEKRLKMEIRQF